MSAGAGERETSGSFSGSLGQTTGTRDNYLKTSSDKDLRGKRSKLTKRASPDLDDNLFELGTVRLPCEVNELVLHPCCCVTLARHSTAIPEIAQQSILAAAGGAKRSADQNLHTLLSCSSLSLWLCKEA